MKKLIVGITAEGSVNLLRGQMQYFKDQGYDTYLLAPYSERSAAFCKRENCKHIIVPLKREISVFSDFVNLIRILIIFLKIRPDIINLGTPKVSLLGMIAGKLLGVKKRIYTCRGFRYEHEKGLKKKILMRMERITSGFAHHIICISPSLLERGLEDNIFSINKAFVINKGSSNGVDLKLFNKDLISAETIADIKTELEFNNKFIFGFVGRIYDGKGINELVESFSNLYSEYSDVRLVLIGPIEHNEISNRKVISDIKNHSGVLHLGRKVQEDVPKYMSLIDCLVLPTWWEGFGNVLIQAAAMGVPVISTLTTGARDAVCDGFNGLLVPPKSKEALLMAMKKLYEDKKLRLQYGENGKVWAANFKQEIIWEGLLSLYKSA